MQNSNSELKSKTNKTKDIALENRLSQKKREYFSFLKYCVERKSIYLSNEIDSIFHVMKNFVFLNF